MSLETSIGKLCYAFNQGVNGAMSMRVKSCVKNYSIWGGVVMAIPLFGLDVIAYGIILWSMYNSISKIAGVPFSGHFMKNVIGGFIVNLIIMFIVNLIADFILFFGWIGMGIAGYYATKYSGAACIEILAGLHGSHNVNERLDYNKGIEAFKAEGGVSAAKGVATGMVMQELTNSDKLEKIE